ncbi:putative oxidoreductase [Microlunatus sagamiharensis]|uniref:Putative oxidoreductase n=1 Tax=Microlunatus sagamiharensis TaxID=546874 RepID=A0A1H2MKK6_9ACTN|nr:DoxX family membrane protein [Microlunatus sagamiharensis]SDU93545.1 putative oxidoreductase [Microlunatus sagamiharensis]
MSKGTDLGLLVLRLGFGAAAAAHGAQKLFGWFGGYGIEGTGGFFESIGFTPGKRNATLAGLAEGAGGAAVALGLATGPAGAALAGNMVVASSVHGFEKFFAQDGGPEMPLAYAAVGSALTLAGGGRYSLDHLTGHVLDKPWMRTVAYVGAAGAAAAIIVARRQELASRPPAEVPAGDTDPEA